jgi:hypothetical protein
MRSATFWMRAPWDEEGSAVMSQQINARVAVVGNARRCHQPPAHRVITNDREHSLVQLLVLRLIPPRSTWKYFKNILPLQLEDRTSRSQSQ